MDVTIVDEMPPVPARLIVRIEDTKDRAMTITMIGLLVVNTVVVEAIAEDIKDNTTTEGTIPVRVLNARLRTVTGRGRDTTIGDTPENLEIRNRGPLVDLLRREVVTGSAPGTIKDRRVETVASVGTRKEIEIDLTEKVEDSTLENSQSGNHLHWEIVSCPSQMLNYKSPRLYRTAEANPVASPLQISTSPEKVVVRC